jgi:hypothetical protein
MEINHAMTFGKEPFGDGIGPFKDRGEPTGIILHKGYIIAEWGEPARVDMTHSVTKSFLSTVVGLAVDQGLISSVNDTVANYIPPIEVYHPDQINRPAEQLGQAQMRYPFSYLGRAVAPDQRLGRNTLGQTRLGRSTCCQQRRVVDAQKRNPRRRV